MLAPASSWTLLGMALALTGGAAQASGAGEPTLFAAARHTAPGELRVEAPRLWPDTSRAVVADTTKQPGLTPDASSPAADDDKPTRKTALFTALAIAVLTVTTLLLYNVRSR